MLIGPRYATMSGIGNPYRCRYLRMSIARTVQEAAYATVLKVTLENAERDLYAWPAGTAVTVSTIDEGGATIPIENQTAQNILTGAGSGFACSWRDYSYPLNVTIDLGKGNFVDTSAMCIWRWYSIDHTKKTCPSVFILQGSMDGVTWWSLDFYSPPYDGSQLTVNGDNLAYSGFIGRRLQYLESSGTQYIDTGIYDQNCYGYNLSFQPVGDWVEHGAMFGVRIGGTRAGSTGIENVSESVDMIGVWKDSKVASANVDRQALNSIFIKPPIESDQGNEVTFTVNNVSHRLESLNTDTFQSANMYLFAANGAGEGERQPCRIAGYSVVTGDAGSEQYDAEQDLIPVSVGGEGMMFDKVSGKLYVNAGTGSFIRGPETPPIKVEVT